MLLPGLRRAKAAKVALCYTIQMVCGFSWSLSDSLIRALGGEKEEFSASLQCLALESERLRQAALLSGDHGGPGRAQRGKKYILRQHPTIPIFCGQGLRTRAEAAEKECEELRNECQGPALGLDRSFVRFRCRRTKVGTS